MLCSKDVESPDVTGAAGIALVDGDGIAGVLCWDKITGVPPVGTLTRAGEEPTGTRGVNWVVVGDAYEIGFW